MCHCCCIFCCLSLSASLCHPRPITSTNKFIFFPAFILLFNLIHRISKALRSQLAICTKSSITMVPTSQFVPTAANNNNNQQQHTVVPFTYSCDAPTLRWHRIHKWVHIHPKLANVAITIYSAIFTFARYFAICQADRNIETFSRYMPKLPK